MTAAAVVIQQQLREQEWRTRAVVAAVTRLATARAAAVLQQHKQMGLQARFAVVEVRLADIAAYAAVANSSAVPAPASDVGATFGAFDAHLRRYRTSVLVEIYRAKSNWYGNVPGKV